MSQTLERTGEVIDHHPVDAAAAARARYAQFRGSADYAIDDKGRLTIPAFMRKPLMGGATLAVLDGQAMLWSDEGFAYVVEELRGQIPTGALTSAQVRRFISGSHTIVPDAQGRIVVPPEARIEAGLERDVRVSGVGSHIEITAIAADEVDEGIAQAIVDVIDMAML